MLQERILILRELLGVTKNLKSPSTTIFLKGDYGNHQNKSQYVKNKLEFTVLKDVASLRMKYSMIQKILFMKLI